MSPGCLRVSAEPARAARSGPAAGAPNHSRRPPLPDAPPAAADASGSAVPRLRDHSRRPGSRPQFRPARAPGLICAPGREASEVQTAGCSRLLCPLGRSRRDGNPPAATDPRCEAWTERIYEANSCIYTRPGLPPEVGAGAASPSPPPGQVSRARDSPSGPQIHAPAPKISTLTLALGPSEESGSTLCILGQNRLTDWSKLSRCRAGLGGV